MRNDYRNGSGYDAQDLYRTPPEAAKILEEVARLIELAGDNPPREVMNYKEAADFLRLSEDNFRHIAPSLPRHKRPVMSYRYLHSELLEWLVSSQDDAPPPWPAEPREPEKKGKRKRVRRLG